MRCVLGIQNHIVAVLMAKFFAHASSNYLCNVRNTVRIASSHMTNSETPSAMRIFRQSIFFIKLADAMMKMCENVQSVDCGCRSVNKIYGGFNHIH
jgi:hypothetical protein